MTQRELILVLKETIAKETGISVSEISDTDTFFQLGLDSISCVFVMEQLERQLSISLTPISFWDYPSLDVYARFLETDFYPKS